MVDKTGQIVFSVLIKSFRFENQLMEDHFNENYLESSKIPKADFKGFISNITTVDFSKEGRYQIELNGTLTIHGVSQKVSTTGTLTIVASKPTITGIFKIKIKDYTRIFFSIFLYFHPTDPKIKPAKDYIYKSSLRAKY